MASGRPQALHQYQGRQASSGRSNVRKWLRVSRVRNRMPLKRPRKDGIGFQVGLCDTSRSEYQAASGNSGVATSLRVSSLGIVWAIKRPSAANRESSSGGHQSTHLEQGHQATSGESVGAARHEFPPKPIRILLAAERRSLRYAICVADVPNSYLGRVRSVAIGYNSMGRSRCTARKPAPSRWALLFKIDAAKPIDALPPMAKYEAQKDRPCKRRSP